MLRPRFLRVVVSCLLLTAPLAGCDKSGDGTKTPADSGAKADNGGDPGMRYRAKPLKLKQSSTFEFQLSGGGQVGSAKADVAGILDLTPAGDKMKVTWKVTEVNSLEIKGAIAPKAEDGKPNPLPDPKVTLLEKGEGAFVMDLRGETDDDATKALPENTAKIKAAEDRKMAREEARAAAKAKKDAGGGAKKASDKEDTEADDETSGMTDEMRAAAAGEQLVGLFAGVFQLPSLPDKLLEEGKPVSVEEEDEVPLGDSGIMLPYESETIYTLIKIDGSSGKRIAEIEVEVEGSGATEMQGGMLVVDSSTEATIFFNLDDNVPVSMTVTATQAFSVGDNGQETTTITESTFTLLP